MSELSRRPALREQMIYEENVRLNREAAAASIGWQPIETAPKDGTRIVCCGMKDVDAKNWDEQWAVLCWKTNPRIVAVNQTEDRKWLLESGETTILSESYFGIPGELDDYDLAVPGYGPTHWHPLEAVPK